jgi:hypothetical protein
LPETGRVREPDPPANPVPLTPGQALPVTGTSKSPPPSTLPVQRGSLLKKTSQMPVTPFSPHRSPLPAAPASPCPPSPPLKPAVSHSSAAQAGCVLLLYCSSRACRPASPALSTEKPNPW